MNTEYLRGVLQRFVTTGQSLNSLDKGDPESVGKIIFRALNHAEEAVEDMVTKRIKPSQANRELINTYQMLEDYHREAAGTSGPRKLICSSVMAMIQEVRYYIETKLVPVQETNKLD